jgi:2,3-bisphosphoglycerate-independent phosphoglycerate mutase
VLADHGNSDNEINPDGSPNTQHSTNPVPSILVGAGYEAGKGITIVDGKLGDVAPTILKIMGITAPDEMKGNVLI